MRIVAICEKCDARVEVWRGDGCRLHFDHVCDTPQNAPIVSPDKGPIRVRDLDGRGQVQRCPVF
jgi:hypothetical protein